MKADPIQGQYFLWKLFRRDGVIYADGRGNNPTLKKYSLGTRDRKEALQLLSQLDQKLAVELGIVLNTNRASVTRSNSVKEVWQDFLRYCERPAISGGTCLKTYKRYRAVSDKHIAFCDAHQCTDWSDVDRIHVDRYGRYLDRKGYAPRSLYLEMTLLVQVTNWLISEHRLPAEKKLSLRLQKPKGTDTYCFRPEEVDAILRRCREQSHLRWMFPLVATLAATGLRIGEAEQLRWVDVDLNNCVLHVADERYSSRKQALGTARTSKGKRSRVIPIHPDLKTILYGLPRHSDGQVFHGPLGGQLKQDTARNIFRREVIEPLSDQFRTTRGDIGFKHARFHSFRHFFVSQCTEHGCSEGEIMTWTGHRDTELVAHYRHLRQEESRRKIERIPFINTPAHEVAHCASPVTGEHLTEVPPQ
ncbi:MAG: site-specific integrase [Planctomycetaceae bacterium]